MERRDLIAADREYRENPLAFAAWSSDAYDGYMSYTVRLNKYETSNFPPYHAPPPTAVVRRLVINEIDGMLIEDEDTETWGIRGMAHAT